MKTKFILFKLGALALGILLSNAGFSQQQQKRRSSATQRQVKKSPSQSQKPLQVQKPQRQNAENTPDTAEASQPKRAPQRLYTPLSFSASYLRERTELRETATGRFEPLFNDLFMGGVGSSIFYRLNAQFEILFPIYLLGGISKLGNADPTPVTTVTQTPTLAFGLSGGPGLGWRFYRSPGFFLTFMAGGIAVLRFQKFATHPDGVIQTSSLAILPGASAGLKIGLGRDFQIDLIYSALRIDFLQPQAGLGLSFNL